MALNANDFMCGMNHFVIGNMDAWMNANKTQGKWNACAVQKGVKYVCLKQVFFNKFGVIKEVAKGEW